MGESHRSKRPPVDEAATDSWDAKNRERLRLIDKKYDEGLDPVETERLQRLKREVAAHVEAIAPRDDGFLKEQAARIEELKRKKARAKRGEIG